MAADNWIQKLAQWLDRFADVAGRAIRPLYFKYLWWKSKRVRKKCEADPELVENEYRDFIWNFMWNLVNPYRPKIRDNVVAAFMSLYEVEGISAALSYTPPLIECAVEVPDGVGSEIERPREVLTDSFLETPGVYACVTCGRVIREIAEEDPALLEHKIGPVRTAVRNDRPVPADARKAYEIFVEWEKQKKEETEAG